jgi:putative ABC transport system permease protein
VVLVYLAQIVILALIGTTAGLIFGQLLLQLLLRLAGTMLPISLSHEVFAAPLLIAGGAGLLTAIAFALWPLGLAREVSPAGLFRSVSVGTAAIPRRPFLAGIGSCVLGLSLLAVLGVPRPEIGAIFVAVAVVSALLLTAFAKGLLRLLGQLAEAGPTSLRLALRNLRSPGNGAAAVTIALGSGLAVLTTVALLQSNLEREIEASVPERAPSTIFIDIQPDQWEPFRDTVGAMAGARLIESAPQLRARVVRLDGIPAEEANVAENVRWTLRRDRGLTYAATMPESAELAAGQWWPSDYAGPPLVSVEDEVAIGYGLGIGDTISFNILGRTIEAEIANLRREIDWASGRLGFIFILSPGVIEAAPHTIVATVETGPGAEVPLIDRVAQAMPNVTPISVGHIVAQIEETLGRIGMAVRVVAGVTLLTGILVLAGAVGAARRRQQRQTVILKILGAQRRDVLRLLGTEYLVLGACAAIVGCSLGTLGAWIVTREVFELPWRFDPPVVLMLAGLSLALTILIGGVAVWRLLGRPTARILQANA